MNNAVSELDLNKTPNGSPEGTRLRLAKTTAMNVVDLHKSYRKAKHEVQVLKGIDLEVHEGRVYRDRWTKWFG